MSNSLDLGQGQCFVSPDLASQTNQLSVDEKKNLCKKRDIHGVLCITVKIITSICTKWNEFFQHPSDGPFSAIGSESYW